MSAWLFGCWVLLKKVLASASVKVDARWMLMLPHISCHLLLPHYHFIRFPRFSRSIPLILLLLLLLPLPLLSFGVGLLLVPDKP